MDLQSILYEAHSGSWAFLIIFFLISYLFPKQKVTMMIERLFVVIMILSGAGMVALYGFPLLSIFKGVLALIFIGVMEMMFVRRRAGQKHAMFWIIWIILFAIILSIGYDVIG